MLDSADLLWTPVRHAPELRRSAHEVLRQGFLSAVDVNLLSPVF